jgi:YbbR domain-containing protein
MGYLIWLHLGAQNIVTHSLVMPVYLYNTSHESLQNIPEKIRVTVQGPRQVMRNLTEDDYGVFVDAKQTQKNMLFTLKRNNIFLPTSVNVLSFSPSTIQIF